MDDNSYTLLTFIKENSSAIFGLIGTFFGGLFGFFVNLFLQNNESKSRREDKIISLRIETHKKFLTLIAELNKTKSILLSDKFVECVLVLTSFEKYTNWHNQLWRFTSTDFIWFSEDVNKELSFFNGYIERLNSYLLDKRLDEGKFPIIGNFLTSDFKKIGLKFQSLIRDYYRKDFFKKTIDKNPILSEEIPEDKELEQHYSNFDFFTMWFQAFSATRLLKTSLGL